MKKITSYAILTILPIILTITAIAYKNTKGEFYLANYSDPSYAYLINSLNLAQLKGHGVGHFDHPGTTVQIIGAIVIKISHTVKYVHKDIVRDVFSRPEFYIEKIHLLFVIMIAIALFILGILSYKKIGNIYGAIFLQLTPFYFYSVYYGLASTIPETFLIFTTLLFIAITICFVNEENLSSKKTLKYTIGFGVICGLGLATKITFFPLLVIPFILIKRISFKVLFLFLTLIFFLIFVYPAISLEHSYQFFNWVKALLINSGKYGEGPNNFIDFSNFFEYIKIIFLYDIFFSFSYLVVVMTFILQFIPRFRSEMRENKYYKLLIAICIAMTVHIFIVVKQFSIIYMLPADMLSILCLYTAGSIITILLPNFRERRKLIYLYIILIPFSLLQLKTIRKNIDDFEWWRHAGQEAIDYLEKNYKNSVVIVTAGSSNKEFALYCGIAEAGSQTKKYYFILRNIYPDYFYYNKWTKKFDDSFVDMNYIKTTLMNSKKFIFQCDNKEVFDNFMVSIKEIINKQNATYKNVFLNYRGEAIYEITLEPS